MIDDGFGVGYSPRDDETVVRSFSPKQLSYKQERGSLSVKHYCSRLPSILHSKHIATCSVPIMVIVERQRVKQNNNKLTR